MMIQVGFVIPPVKDRRIILTYGSGANLQKGDHTMNCQKKTQQHIKNWNVPRMRTIPKIIAEIKALDPETEVTEHWVRQLAKTGAVPVVWAGCKALINLDDVLALLCTGTEKRTPEPDTVGGIRRIKDGRV